MSTNDEVPDRELPSALGLLARLLLEHKTDQFVYRGQVERYPKHKYYIKREGGQVDVENMYPSDFRFITGLNGTELGWTTTNQDVNARNKGRDRRDRFEQFILSKAAHALDDGDSRYSWFRPYFSHVREATERIQHQAEQSHRIFYDPLVENKIDPRSFPLMRITWSLAQHYLLATALTDITFDPAVALWFATNEWEVNIPRPATGTGVIYRFDREKLEYFLATRTKVNSLRSDFEGSVRPPAYFLEDIRLIPREFAGRPQGQKGGSIYGLDSPVHVHQLFKFGACEAFPFRHSGDPPDLGVDRADIMPADDPFLPLKEEFQASEPQAA